MKFKFPPNFFWGSSISSYQTEGNNYQSDWYFWEKFNNLTPAGRTCNHYHLFPSDFDLACNLFHNALRFSIEWSRIFPQEGIFSHQEACHYQKVVDALIQRKLTPFVTLYHFSLPQWLAKKGGWLHPKTIDYFLEFIRKIVAILKGKVNYWLIINEPLVYVYNSFIRGLWPPGKKSLSEAKRVLKHLGEAYLNGYKEIKSLYFGEAYKSYVSLAKNMIYFSPCKFGNLGQHSFSAYIRNRHFNYQFLDFLAEKNLLDFLGINYYFCQYSRFQGFIGKACNSSHHRERKNSLGWHIYPEGLYKILLKLKRYNLPIIITENGTSETQEQFYEEYLVGHLKMIAKSIKEKVDVQGYFWWSLLDNFEWDKGYEHKFGLIEVDFSTQKRKIRPFAFIYKEISRSNSIEIP